MLHLPLPTLPLIHHISAFHQSIILALLLLISYFHKGARYLFSGLILTFIAYKTLVPIVLLGYKIFRWIAMFGFYVHYFQIGVGFIMTGLGGVVLFLEALTREHAAAQAT